MNKENTSTWVDERYARRLAAQARRHLDVDAEPLATLKGARSFPGYLRDEPVRLGFGVKRQGRRVNYVDPVEPEISTSERS